MTDMPCPFCTLDLSGVIASNDSAFAFFDRFPVAENHTLIVPKKHIESLFDLEADAIASVWNLVSQVRNKLVEQYGVAAFNIGVNDGMLAGQTVLHAHVHVIPRVAGDSDDPRGGIRWVIPDKARYW